MVDELAGVAYMNTMTKSNPKSTGKSAKRLSHRHGSANVRSSRPALGESRVRDTVMTQESEPVQTTVPAQGSATVSSHAPAVSEWQHVASTAATTAAKQKPGTFSKLIDDLSRAASKSHRPQYLMVTPAGDVMVAKDATDAAAPRAGRIVTQTPVAAAALEVALERGRLTAAAILAGKDMLTADELKKAIPVSKTTFHNWRKTGKLLALPHPNGSFRFPVWQFGSDGLPFPFMPQLFEILGSPGKPASPWSVYRFLVQHHNELGGMTGIQTAAAGKWDDLIETALAIRDGTFS